MREAEQFLCEKNRLIQTKNETDVLDFRPPKVKKACRCNKNNSLWIAIENDWEFLN